MRNPGAKQPAPAARYSRDVPIFCKIPRVRAFSHKMGLVIPPVVDSWLAAFALEPFLRTHVATVFAALPDHVRSDFLGDPSFSLCDYEPSLAPAHIPLRAPSAKRPSRCVVLKRTLRR